jgi:polyisoprenoid-binding protein YceI
MLRCAAAFVLAATIAAPAFAQSASKDPSQAPSGAYTVDTAHSQVLFAIPHSASTRPAWTRRAAK